MYLLLYWNLNVKSLLILFYYFDSKTDFTNIHVSQNVNREQVNFV